MEQRALKGALDQQAETQQQMLDDIRRYNEKRDTDVSKLVSSLNTELEQTRAALQDARAALEGNELRRKVCELGFGADIPSYRPL
jgi:predicted  nucleic acid-binding Zn-ribbon protein